MADWVMNIADGCGDDVCGLKYVSHKNKFIFFEVPKNGSASLIEIFTEHALITQLEDRYSFLEYPDYLKCAFSRNPWDRILSCYLNKIKKDENFNNDKFENGVMKRFKKFDVFYAGMPFNEFVQEVANIPDDIADGHFASQHKRLVMNGKVVVNFLGRFEYYEEEVIRLLKIVGINSEIKFPHINRSRNRKRYPEYYDDTTKKIVESRYKEDIELFGYEFEALEGINVSGVA